MYIPYSGIDLSLWWDGVDKGNRGVAFPTQSGCPTIAHCWILIQHFNSIQIYLFGKALINAWRETNTLHWSKIIEETGFHSILRPSEALWKPKSPKIATRKIIQSHNPFRGQDCRGPRSSGLENNASNLAFRGHPQRKYQRSRSDHHEGPKMHAEQEKNQQ